MKFNYFIYLLFAFLFNSTVLSQNLFLYGTVIDNTTKKPISNVNVYLANTQIGTTTNKSGYFELDNLPQGTFSVIFSHVSYCFLSKKITLIRKYNDIGITELSLKVYKLGTVVVQGNNNLWKERFKIFRNNFIGTENNADSTFVENPYKIDFTNKNGKLFATSKEPLIILNKSLGYKIKYFLNYFEECDEYTKYSGDAVFSNLPSSSKSDSLMWIKNREATYVGSLRHFLDVLNTAYSQFVFGHKSYNLRDGYSIDTRFSKCKSLINNKGFFIFRVDKLPAQTFQSSSEIPISMKNLLSKGKIKTETFLKFQNYLRIYFLPNYKIGQYPLNFNIKNIYNAEGSYLELTKDSVFVDIHGRYFDKFGIHTYGKFGRERISDLLPYEYEYVK